VAADRLQIVLEAKNNISTELKQVKAEMSRLATTSSELHRRMDAGEQGLQREYEQTRLALEKNRQKQLELGRAAAKTKSEIKQLTSEGTDGAKRMDRSFDGVSRSMGKTHTASQKLAIGWGKAMGVYAAITAGIAGLSGAFNFLADSVNEARTARKAMAQTAAVMRSMGRTEAPARVNKMIDQLEQMSGIDGDNIREMTNVLFTFGNVTGKTFEKANRLALDVSVAFGKDLQSSAVMVGKALNDPAKGLSALTRIGVQFTARQQEQVKAMMAVGDQAGAQKIILAELKRQVGGSAKAQADQIAKTQVAWGNLKEAIGDALMATGSGFDLAGLLKQATKWIKQHKREIVSVLQSIMSAVLKLISFYLKMESIFLRVFGEMIGAMATTLKVLNAVGLVSDNTVKAVDDLANGFGKASEQANKASKWFDGLSTKAHTAAKQSRMLADALRGIKAPKAVKDILEFTAGGLVNVVTGGVGAPVDNNWMGGPVSAGTRSWVGELGPELFKPLAGPMRIIGADGPEIIDFRQSGTVIPNHLIAPAVTVTTPAAATPVPVSGGVHIGTMVVKDRFDAQRELSALMRREERIRRERR